MPLVEVLGVVAALVSAVTGIPQLWRLIFGTTGVGVAPMTWWFAFCAAAVWVAHGIRFGEWAAVGANTFTAVCTAAILARLFALDRRSREHRNALVVPFVVALIVAIVAVSGQISLGWIAGGLGLLRFLPQAYKVFAQQENAGVSIWTWALSGLANLLWTVYGLLHADPAMATPAAIAAPTAWLIVLRLWWVRRSHARADVTSSTLGN